MNVGHDLSVGSVSNDASFQSVDTVAHRELKSLRTGELYSHAAVISELIGMKNLFVHHEIIPPGRRASAPHIHSEQEEMIFVLEGTPIARFGDQAIQLNAGAFMGFKPGGPDAHFVENKSAEDVRLLVISPKRNADQVIFPGV
jgi:uncharacterized cupin superfamily protein